jgi:HEAT repeat protein
VLATFDFGKTKQEYIFQLDHALDIADRITAAKQLKESNNDSVVFAALRKAATGDRFWAVRNQAVLSLSSSDNRRVKEVLLGCTRDQHSSVRSSAIAQLSRFSSRDVGNAVWSAALTDSSYLVLSSCIETLAEIDSVRGFDLAMRSVQTKSYRDIVRRAALEAFLTLNDPRALPFALTHAGVANPTDIRRLSVQVLAALAKNSLTARTRLLELINDDMGAVRRAAIEGIAESGDPDARSVIVKRQLVEKDETVRNAIDRVLQTFTTSPQSNGEK